LELIKKKLPLLEQPGELDRIGIVFDRMGMLMRLLPLSSKECISKYFGESNFLRFDQAFTKNTSTLMPLN
jgi:hypothetical protein